MSAECWTLHNDHRSLIGVTNTADGARRLGDAWVEACEREVTTLEGGWLDLSRDKDESHIALYYLAWDARAKRIDTKCVYAHRTVISDDARWPR